MLTWLKVLTKSSEAHRCVHYLFKHKFAEVELSNLSWHNLLKLYERCKSDELKHSRCGSTQSDDSLDINQQPQRNATEKASRTIEEYRQIFENILLIVQKFSLQIFEKVGTIPYALRQFCKCLYEAARLKFPATSECELYQLVGHYLLKNWLLKAISEQIHMTGMIKEFFINGPCRKNLQLAAHVLLSVITQRDWEVDSSSSSSSEAGNVFTTPGWLRKSLTREKSVGFFRSLLQIQKDLSSDKSLEQPFEGQAQKFQWHVMLLSMAQINLLLEFFRAQKDSQFKGIKNLMDKIDHFHAEEGILSELEWQATGDVVPTKYYLLVKQPALKEIRIEHTAEGGSAQELLFRGHVKELLVESDLLSQFAPLVRDPNSTSQILNLLRQHIEKKKVFSSDTVDLKYTFVINALNTHFIQYKNEMRDQFKKFVQRAIED